MRHAIALSVIALMLTIGATVASAQSAGPDEAIKPNGAVEQQFALTTGQRQAIYNLVIQQRVKPRSRELSVAVGAPVPPSTELTDLPDQVAADDPSSASLKYALVENDIVVVDPAAMRVVEVIHNGARP